MTLQTKLIGFELCQWRVLTGNTGEKYALYPHVSPTKQDLLDALSKGYRGLEARIDTLEADLLCACEAAHTVTEHLGALHEQDKARIATLEAELLAARDSRSQRTADAVRSLEEWIDKYQLSAGFIDHERNVSEIEKFVAEIREQDKARIATLEAEFASWFSYDQMRSEENHSLLRGLSECKSTMMSQGAQITTFKARIATLEAELLAARDSQPQSAEDHRATGTEPRVVSAGVRDSLDDNGFPVLDIECRFSDGQKFAAVQVSADFPSLASGVADFLNGGARIATLEAELLAARDLLAAKEEETHL